MPWNSRKDQLALEALTRLASRYSPLAESEFSALYCSINLDITGSLRLFGGAEAIAQSLQRLFTQLGFSTRIAIAPTLGAAWGFARFNPTPLSFVEAEELQNRAVTLPIAALRLEQKTLEQLSEVGVTHLKHLLTIAPAALLDRFGPQVLTRISQFLGLSVEVIQPLRNTTRLTSEIVFDSPCEDLANIELACQELISQLLAQLNSSQERVRHFTFQFTRPRQATIEKTIILSAPSNNFPHIWSLVRPRLEQLQTCSGIEKIALTIIHKQHAHPRLISLPQLALAEDFHQEKPHELLDVLSAQLGNAQVRSLVENDSHIPERSFSFTPIAQVAPLTAQTRQRHATSPQADPELPLAVRHRPSILFEYPLPIRTIALLPDKPPSRLIWQGKPQRIIQGIGPERIDHEWWLTIRASTPKAAPAPQENRDYFRVQIETGTWLWVFRELPSTRWFIHGLWA